MYRGAFALALAVVILAACVAALLGGCSGSSGPGPLAVRQDITVAQLQALYGDGRPLTIVDVSESSVFTVKHIPGSVNVALDDVASWGHGRDIWERICCVCT